MLFQMQIPEMFSYVGMKDTSYTSKYQVKCFLFIPKKNKLEERVKTTTQAVYEHFLYNLFAAFPFCIYLYFYLQYLSTFKI